MERRKGRISEEEKENKGEGIEGERKNKGEEKGRIE